ncbi:TIGR04222 domain-containing membrane protein [Micromonospora cathayae]|uniref:TIGR04222 domain-containing membrane protein n=1 Tax=Micromonospora cathayae TaxID=3028804 RepID=A0ABY7ZP18_9ACTN|nr:TIGR04222 domain-containing membrane protein [Micromonospora sp. HUAS 3]WDZ84176.1 TIGR04222 domain-containing membrane protein [Micromonospora sp. HUAS 3]
MTQLAAAGDTWGISGPAFLAIYLSFAILVVLGSVVHRAWLFGGSNRSRYDQLGPQQVAYLNGGARLALYSAIGALRSVGAIGADQHRLLRATGPLPAGATPLDQAVHHAAGRGARTRDLPRDHWVSTALDQLRQDLENRGLALSAEQRRSARLGPFLLLVLLAVGVLRLIAGLGNGRPVGLLLVSLLVLGVVFVVQMARVPHRTRAGRQALSSLRTHYRYLAPASAPAYGTYGAAGAAMSVAVFGAAALWTLDPAFAAEAEIQRNAAASSGSSYGDGGGGDSGGSGDSGGGDSGGGGGCGGGGCGGGCGG